MANMEKVRLNGYLVGTSDTMDVYSYNCDKYICLKEDGEIRKVTVISGYYH